MIYEFALEPALLNNWRDFRYFTESFGFPLGRLISRYPKRWKRLVYDSLDACGDVEKKRVEEGLRRIDDRIIKRPNLIWNNEHNWLTNAEAEHARRPFRAIVASANPNACAFVLVGEDVRETNPLWRVNRTSVVERQPTPMAQALAPFLRVADAILFVDPHFNPNRPNYRQTLLEFLGAIFDRRECRLPTRIEIHLSADGDDKPTAQFFDQSCRANLPNLTPFGVQLQIFRWRQRPGGQELHNRYVLTNMGGVRFGAGLDAGDLGETDEVELLDDETYSLRWAEYDPAGPAFDLADQVVVRGTRR